VEVRGDAQWMLWPSWRTKLASRIPLTARGYLRKRCGCGASEKRRLDKLGSLPVTSRDDDIPLVVF